MANWQNTNKVSKYTGYLYSTDKCDGSIKATIQYDKDTISTTSTKIRFKLDRDNQNGYKGLEFWILINPGKQNKEKFIRVKEGDTNWPGYSSSITLNKDTKDSSFNVPEFWICNIGASCNSDGIVNKNGYYYISYDDNGEQTVYNYFRTNDNFYGSPRQNYKTKVDSSTISISGTTAGAPTISAVTASNVILNNDKNKGYFQVQAKADVTKVGNGASTISSRVCGLYGVTSEGKIDTSTKYVSGLSFKDNEPRYMQSDSKLYLKPNTEYCVRFKATNNLGISVKFDENIITPAITKPSGKCLNLKLNSDNDIFPNSNLTFSWNIPKSGLGTKVGTFGYQIRVFKNNKNITNDRELPTGLYINESIPTYWFGSNLNTDSISISGSKCIKSGTKFKAGDIIKFEVLPYVYYLSKYYADGTKKTVSSEYKVSSDDTLIRIKTDDGWKFGKIYVNTAQMGATPNWKVGKSLYVNSDGIWKKAK